MVSGIGKRRAAAKRDRSEIYERRRKEISEAAARVFDQRGFAETTISAVAEELNIERASLYYYISSKEELFDELIREVSEENLAIASRIQASNATPEEKIRQLIVQLMESYAGTYPLLFIYIRENLNQVSERRGRWAKYMKEINRKYDNTVIAMIEEGYRDGSFRNIGPAKMVAYGIIGMLAWTNRWFKPDKENGKASGTEVGQLFAELVTAGLRSGNLPLRKVPRKTPRKRRA